MTRVAVVQELLPRYRSRFFDLLRARLAHEGVELVLVHGRARGDRALLADEGDLPWAHVVDSTQLGMGRGTPLVWQRALSHLDGADLVVVEQASRHLLNYLLMARRATRRQRLAFWGHGANLQARSDRSWRERWKRLYSRNADWWFAYTDGAARRVAALGFPPERITVVQNATDVAAVPPLPREPGRTCFVGGLHQHKQIPFLLGAAAMAARSVDGFRLVVAGDGPERATVERALVRSPWLELLPPQFGADKSRVLLSSQLVLMPGLVGLVAVDSLRTATPIVTVEGPHHSPEYEYLTPQNASVLPRGATPEDYAAEVRRLLTDDQGLEAMRARCREDGSQLTVEEMARRFAAGVLAALDAG